MAAKKKIVKAYGSKTQFVMGLPHDMSAKEVVSRGKAQGLVLSEAHVYKIRSTNKSKGKAGPAARGGAKAASKPNGRASKASGKGAGLSKRDFVLSFAPSTPAAEVLKKAKQAGLGLSKAYLYTIRAEAGPAAKPAKGAKTSAAAKGAKKGASTPQAQFVEAALALGLARAKSVLDGLRAKSKR